MGWGETVEEKEKGGWGRGGRKEQKQGTRGANAGTRGAKAGTRGAKAGKGASLREGGWGSKE